MTIALMLVSMVSNPLNSQNLQWAKGFASSPSSFAEGVEIKHDQQGDILVVGRFQGTVDFDPGQANISITSNGNNDDIFVLKTDSYGNFIWVRTFGSPQDEIVRDLAIDTAGNVFVTGSFAGVTDFDGGSATVWRTPTGTSDIFLLKVDPNGNFLSINQYGTTGNNLANSLAIDDNGNLLMVGEFRGTIDFDPGPGNFPLTAASITTDVFIQKLDPLGNLLWAKKVGANGSDRGRSVDTDAAGNVVVGGSFQFAPDFDPSAGTFTMAVSGVVDIFLLKLSAAGNFIWAKHMGGSGGQCHLNALTINSKDEIISVGDFGASADFDPNAGTTMLPYVGAYDMYIQCLDANGNLRWVHPFGTINNDYAFNVDLDSLDNVYFTGGYNGYLDFDPSPLGVYMSSSLSNSYDAYVESLDSSGNFNWFAATRGVLGELSYGIDVYPDGSNLTTGSYSGTVDCDPGPQSHILQPPGTNNLYILKLGACPASRFTLPFASCDSFVYHGTTYHASGTYDQVLTNHVNCDSIVTLQLQILAPSSSTLLVDTCGTFWLNGQSFASSGTYTQVIPSSNGCDSTITLQLTTQPNSATTIVDSTCATYNLNGQIYIQSGTYTQVLNNAIGCDSVITLHLTLLQSVHSQTVAACDSFSFAGQVLDSTGSYTFHYTNQFGCDSLEIVNLTITQFQAVATQNGNSLVAGPSGGIFQWVDCNNNYAPIPGATGQMFTPLSSGNYAVLVDYGPCHDLSNCIPITVVGTSAPQSLVVSCYPVPTADHVMVDWGMSADASIKLLNVHGQLLQTLHVTGLSQTTLELPSPAGIYFLMLEVAGQSVVMKVVKELH